MLNDGTSTIKQDAAAAAEVENRYNQRIENSVNAAVRFLGTKPDLQFNFKMASKGNLSSGGHNNPAKEMLDAMGQGDHSQSSINMAFDKVLDAALELGRPVETRKISEGFRVSIKPVEPCRG